MPSDTLSRRRLLRTVPVAAAGLSGCVSEGRGTPTDTPPSAETPSDPTTAGETPAVVSLAVSDFVRYPLAGVHPHVHRRADTQYVVVRLDSSASVESLRDRVRLELDGDPAPLADRQPVPWRTEAVDLAFAVTKGETFDSGRLLFDQTALSSLSNATIDRLNSPPVFTVSEPLASPDELSAGSRVDATVAFTVTNTGDGRGEFGASLTGNATSGWNTLTVTVDSGAQREVTGVTRIAGSGDAATIRLDWGSGEWTTEIPVVGPPESGTATRTPAPK